MISNDPAALEAACSAVLAEGGISEDLRAWQIRCLILMGAGDADFLDQARRAAHEIPKAELLLLEEADHSAAHMSQDEFLLDAVLRKLQRNR